MNKIILDYLSIKELNYEYLKKRAAEVYYETDEYGDRHKHSRLVKIPDETGVKIMLDKKTDVIIRISSTSEFALGPEGIISNEKEYNILKIKSHFLEQKSDKFTDEDSVYISNKLNDEYKSLFYVFVSTSEVSAYIRSNYIYYTLDKDSIHGFLNTFFKELKLARDMVDDYIKNTVSPRQERGCYITTATCLYLQKQDDCYELNKFREFRDSWLLKQPDGVDLVNTYYNISPQIVNNINKLKSPEQIYKNIWKNFLQTCLTMIEDKKFNECKDTYMKMVTSLARTLL